MPRKYQRHTFLAKVLTIIPREKLDELAQCHAHVEHTWLYDKPYICHRIGQYSTNTDLIADLCQYLNEQLDPTLKIDDQETRAAVLDSIDRMLLAT